MQNEEMEIERLNEERGGKWRERGEMRTESDFLPLNFSPFLSISSNFLSIYGICCKCGKYNNIRIMRK